jgi:hypothetical protein
MNIARMVGSFAPTSAAHRGDAERVAISADADHHAKEDQVTPPQAVTSTQLVARTIRRSPDRLRQPDPRARLVEQILRLRSSSTRARRLTRS